MRIQTILFLSVMIFSSRAAAQAPVNGEAPPPTRSLAVCYLFAQEIPTLYYRDAEGEPRVLRMERERFSSENIIPEGTELLLYRKTTDPEGNDIYQQAAIWELPPGLEPVRRFYYLTSDRKLGSFDLTDPPGKHASLGIRAINLTDNPVALSLDDRTETLPPFEERMFSAPADTRVRFKFQYGAQDSLGRMRISPVSNLRFRSEHQRMTLIFGLVPEYDFSGNLREFVGFSVRATRIYDLVPAP